MTQYSRLLFLGTVCLAVASGATITVQNASFETANTLDLTCTGQDCAFNIGEVPGWGTPVNGGSWRPGNSGTFFSFLPDGQTTAYLNSGVLQQTVSETVQSGLTYILQVEIGNRQDFEASGVISLKIGDTLIAGTGSTAAEGGWSTYTAIYTALAGDVGKSISIELGTVAVTGFGQANFDNVRLSSEILLSGDPESPVLPPMPNAVPEPGTVSLIGFGVAAVLWKRRR
jgi:hypothetical protein